MTTPLVERRVGPAVTDVAGELASHAQLARMRLRYAWAATFCKGRTVLEVACGTGQGLGILGGAAARLYGGDYSGQNLAFARATYGSRVPLVRFDAQAIPFHNASLDVVVVLDTLFFLSSPDTFVREAARVLRPGGLVLASVLNKDAPGYMPSDLYPCCFGAGEVADLFRSHGFVPKCFGAVQLERLSLRERVVNLLKRVAGRLHLVPSTMQGRVWLKRLVFGRLVPIPRELNVEPSVIKAVARLQKLAGDRPDRAHQLILCIAHRSEATR